MFFYHSNLFYNWLNTFFLLSGSYHSFTLNFEQPTSACRLQYNAKCSTDFITKLSNNNKHFLLVHSQLSVCHNLFFNYFLLVFFGFSHILMCFHPWQTYSISNAHVHSPTLVFFDPVYTKPPFLVNFGRGTFSWLLWVTMKCSEPYDRHLAHSSSLFFINFTHSQHLPLIFELFFNMFSHVSMRL